MSNICKLAIIAALFASGTGCDTGPHAATGFRLPSSGSIERGQAAFTTHGCSDCHSVAGLDLGSTGRRGAVPLGGSVPRAITDGHLVTSIINPSHRTKPHEGAPDMPNFADRMTVRELTDIVAFLQSRYNVHSLRTNPVVY